jgi:hypothetical protein
LPPRRCCARDDSRRATLGRIRPALTFISGARQRWRAAHALVPWHLGHSYCRHRPSLAASAAPTVNSRQTTVPRANWTAKQHSEAARLLLHPVGHEGPLASRRHFNATTPRCSLSPAARGHPPKPCATAAARVYVAGTQRHRLWVPLSTAKQSVGANHSAPAGPNRAATRPKLT